MKSTTWHVETYLAQLQDMVTSFPVGLIDRIACVLLESARAGRKIFIFGNGGSASTASHFACDLAKNTIVLNAPRLRVISLTDNIPLMTAWANDTAFDNVFAAQLSPLIESGDVVIGISCSGNSTNVLNAMAVARHHGATTIAFTGDDGGQLKNKVDLCFQAPSSHVEQQEDAHLIVEHCVCAAIREELLRSYAFVNHKIPILSSPVTMAS